MQRAEDSIHVGYTFVHNLVGRLVHGARSSDLPPLRRMRADHRFVRVHNLSTSTQDSDAPARGMVSGIRTRECTYVQILSGVPGAA